MEQSKHRYQLSAPITGSYLYLEAFPKDAAKKAYKELRNQIGGSPFENFAILNLDTGETYKYIISDMQEGGTQKQDIKEELYTVAGKYGIPIEKLEMELDKLKEPDKDQVLEQHLLVHLMVIDKLDEVSDMLEQCSRNQRVKRKRERFREKEKDGMCVIL